jgi:hypothetical protein
VPNTPLSLVLLNFYDNPAHSLFLLGGTTAATFYTKEYYDLSATGRVAYLTLELLLPLCSTSEFRWCDWYGFVENWLPNNPVHIDELKKHLLSKECFNHQQFIMFIVPVEPVPVWKMNVYHDYKDPKEDDEEWVMEFGQCYVDFLKTPAKEIIGQLKEMLGVK